MALRVTMRLMRGECFVKSIYDGLEFVIPKAAAYPVERLTQIVGKARKMIIRKLALEVSVIGEDVIVEDHIDAFIERLLNDCERRCTHLVEQKLGNRQRADGATLILNENMRGRVSGKFEQIDGELVFKIDL